MYAGEVCNIALFDNRLYCNCCVLALKCPDLERGFWSSCNTQAPSCLAKDNAVDGRGL